MPKPINTSLPLRASVRSFIQCVRGNVIDLNIIKVGADEFTYRQHAALDYAVIRAREIYWQVGIGVSRIRWFHVSAANAAGYHRPVSLNQLAEMTSRWIIFNGGIDVLVPVFVNSGVGEAGGLGPGDWGPCEDEKGGKGMNGATVSAMGPSDTAILLAHEVGHYLGARHVISNPYNVMFRAVVASADQVYFTAEQGRLMREHCMVRRGIML
jgi:hypothetical protein